MYIVEFQGWMCNINISKYRNNDRTAIELTELGTGEPVAIATVNIPEENIEADEVIIKSYSENQGMYEALLTSGFISPSIRTIKSGWVLLHICKLLIEV